MKKFLSILLAVMMVLSSTVSYAAPSLAGIVDSVVETPVIEEAPAVEVEDSASLSAETQSVVGEYGALVAKFTFDDLTADTDWTTAARTVTSAATGTSRLTDTGGIFGSGEHMNATSSSVPFIYDDGKLSSITVKERASGDNYLELKGSGTNGSFGVRDYNGGGLAKQGHLILTADVLSAANAQPFSKGYFKRTGSNTFDMYETIFGEVTPGEWSQIVISCDDTHLQELSKADGYISAYNATANYIYLIENLAADEVVGIDNLAIWWVPATSEITVDNGMWAENATFTIGNGIKTIAEIEAAMGVELDGYYLKGVKTSADGELITDEVTIIEDKTLYAVWGKENILDSLEFTSSTEGVVYNRGVKMDCDDTIGALTIDYSSWTGTGSYANYNNSNPADTIRFDSIPGADIEDIRIRLKFDNFSAESYYSILYPYYDGTIDTKTYTSVTYKIVDGEWFELSLKEDAGDFENLLNGNLTNLRFDMSGSCDADTIIYIDYIRVIGKPLPQIYVDSDKAEFSDYVASFDTDTTVADVIAELDTSNYIGTYFAKTLKTSSGRILATTDLIKDVAEDEETLSIVWGKYDTFGFDFDTVWVAGGANGNSGDTSSTFTYSPVDADEGEEGIYANLVATTSFADTDTTRYGIRADKGRLNISNINVPAGELNKMIMKLRFVNVPNDGPYYIVAGGAAESSTTTFTYSDEQRYSIIWSQAGDNAATTNGGFYTYFYFPTEGEWMYIEVDGATTGTRTDLQSSITGKSITELGIDTLRFDFPAVPQGFTIQIDDVLFLGQPIPQYNINSEGVVTTEYISSTTTVADILAGFSSSNELLAPRALRYGDTILSGTDTLANVPEYSTLEVLYSSNIIKSYEFNSSVSTETEGVDYNRGVSEYVKDGALVLDYSTSTQLNNAHPGTSIPVGTTLAAGDLKDIKVRLKFVGFNPSDIDNNGKKGFPHYGYAYVNSSVVGSGYGTLYTNAANDEWVEHSFATLSNFSTYYAVANFSHLRFDMSGTVKAKTDKIYIDYIRFIGDPQPVVVLDMGTLADDVYIPYTNTTTVADLIAAAGYESAAISLDGVTYNSTSYVATDTIQSILGGDDAVVKIAYSNKKRLSLNLGTTGLDIDGKVSFANAGYYDGTTTVGDIIDDITVSDSYLGVYELKGLSADGSRTVLDENTTFATLAVDDDVTLKAIWRKKNVIAEWTFDDVTSVPSSVGYNTRTATSLYEADGVKGLKVSCTVDGQWYAQFNPSSAIAFADVEDIIFRVKADATVKTSYFVTENGHTGTFSKTYTFSTSDYDLVSIADWAGGDFSNISISHACCTKETDSGYGLPYDKTVPFNGFRLQSNGALGANLYYDFVRVIGKPLTEIVVDASGLGLGELITGYDANTTFADIIAQLNYPGEKSIEGLVYGGQTYSGATTVASVLNGAEGTFTVAAVSPKFVTLDMNDGPMADIADIAVSGTMTVAELASMITDTGAKKLAGFAATADATEVLASTTLVGNAVTYTDDGTKSTGTIYAIWTDYEWLTGHLEDFDDQAAVNALALRNSKTEKSFGTDDDGTDYIRIKFVDGDANAVYTGSYNTGFTMPTVSASNVIPAGSLDGFVVRLRYIGTPKEKTAYTYSGGTYDYNPASAPNYIYWGATANTPTYGLTDKPLDVSGYEDGEWFTVYYDASSMTSNAETKGNVLGTTDLAYLRYDFPTIMPVDTYIDIDYIGFVGDNSMLPQTTYYLFDMKNGNESASDIVIPDKYTADENGVIAIEPGKTLKLSDFSSQVIDEGDKDFVGFNTDPNATEALTDTALGALVGGGYVTIYAIWNDYEYNTLYSLDFATNSGWSVLSNYSEKDGKYNSDMGTIGGHGSKYQAAYKADPSITAVDSGFITWNEEGYITAHFDVDETAKTAIDSTFTNTDHTSSGYAVCDSRIAIGTLDGKAYIPAGSISKMIVRARINGLENLTANENYWFKYYRFDKESGAWGNLNPAGISLPQLYVTYTDTAPAGDAENGKLVNKTHNITTKVGEWFTFEISAEDLGADLKDIHYMRFDFADTMPDGATVDIDFIRFVGEDYDAPLTYEDKTNVRLGTGEDTRNGVRVVASLNPDIYDENATDIGWMFSASNRWYAAGYTMDELTMDKDSADDGGLIVTGYIREDGEAKANFYDATLDTEWFFSAVLYNIPVKNYKSPFIVRPFAKIYGVYVYGEPFEINFLDFAESVYDNCSDEQQAYIDKCRADFQTYLDSAATSGDIDSNFTDLLAEPATLLSATVIPTNDNSPVVEGDYATITAWQNGSLTTIKVVTKGTWPAIIENGILSDSYDNQPCAIAQIGTTGTYYLKSLANSLNADGGDYIGINKDNSVLDGTDASEMFVSRVESLASPFQRFDRYAQTSSSNASPVTTDSFFLGDFALGTYSHTITNWAGSSKTYENAGKTAYMTDSSKVVVKYELPDGTSEWATYDATALNASGVNGKTTLNQNIEFSELTYVVSNNVNGTSDASTMEAEDLVLLAGVVEVPEYVTSVGDGLDASMYGRIKIKVDSLPSAYYEVSKSFSSSTNVAYTFNLKFTRLDAYGNSKEFTSYAITDKHFGVLAGGGYVLDFDMTLVPEWQGTITDVQLYGTCTYKKNWYSSSYTTVTKDLPTVYTYYLKTSDKSINDDLSEGYEITPMFKDGDFVGGLSVGKMESKFEAITGSNEFVTTDSGYDPSWNIFPGYTYDYISAAATDWWDLSNSQADRFAAIKSHYDTDSSSVTWYTDYELQQIETTDGTALLKDNKESKIVEYRPDETITYADGSSTTGDVLSLTLNNTRLYNGADHVKYNPSAETSGDWYFWPHLLIDQNTDNVPVDSEDPAYQCDADRFYCEFDIRLDNYYQNYNTTTADNVMTFLLYSYIVPKDLPGQKIWFGLNLASDTSSTPSSAINWTRDSGANTHMYCLQAEQVYGGVENSMWAKINSGATSTDWVHVKVDLTAHVQQAIDWANSEDAFGIGVTTLSDWYFNGVNIGFECHDNVDCTFELANFNFYSYNPQ